MDLRPNRKFKNTSLKFWTLSLPCFNKFRELFYNDCGVKIVPININELFTDRSLAYWIMDDGYQSGRGFYLCTESYTIEENNVLKYLLETKFNLNCGIHKHSNGYRLYIFSNSKNKLLSIIKPYLLSHFNYKFS